MSKYIEVDKNKVLKHYSRIEVQEEILRCSTDKEVVGSYGGKGYAKRPDTLMYAGDVLELVKQGITSFHFSEETWQNPLSIDPLMKKNEIENLRIGWDLILDIDCDELEYSAMAAHLLIQALKYHEIENISVKFSGNHGFHIAVPFESFPEYINDMEVRKLFPEAPRRIALYLKEMIREHLTNMLQKDSLEEMAKKSNNPELLQKEKFDPFDVLEVDTILISSRHLLRHVFSFNEKSGLVSIPITSEEVLGFKKDRSLPENITDFSIKFLDRTKSKKGEANHLFVQAFDFKPQIEDEFKQLVESKKEYEIPEEAIPEEYFPPCIKKVFLGLTDGKKRALFILINFLRCVGWSYEQIVDRLKEWNKVNPEQLRETILLGQIRYHKQQKKNIMPPNCTSSYYKDLQICFPDNLCNKIKNPIQYSRRKTFFKKP